jgi:hypothetical protein
MLNQMNPMHTWVKVKASQFLADRRGDEIYEKAAVIAAVTAAVLVIIVLGALAASALQRGTSWFN